MPGTSAAFAGVAAANAAIAAEEARRAQIAACQAQMPVFNAQTASVEQMHDYADCVNLLYPQELSSGETVFVKILIVGAFLAVLGGAVYGHLKRNSDDLIDNLWIGALVGAMIYGGGVLVLWLAIAGIRFLLT
jgi:hypothetical protein